MNILPLVLALVLILTVLTVEQIEKFKNQTIVQKEYQHFLSANEGVVFNKRQKRMFKISEKSLRQLSFRYFIDKEAKEANAGIAAQYRLLMIALMKNIYGKAPFYKKIEESRPNFLEEMLNAIELAASKSPESSFKRIQDIARLNLEDDSLQEAFYHMLKGTIARDEIAKFKNEPQKIKEKGYVSLFTFINNNGAKKKTGQYTIPRIVVQRAPREILKTVFENDDVVEEIIVKRDQLSKSKDKGASALFKSEFVNKRRPGIDDLLLDFTISDSAKTGYN